MGIFSRLSDLLKSNVNDLIDKAEDPEKMVKQIIIDMQQELNKSTQALGKAMAAERTAKNQYDNAAKKSAEWEEKAKAALTAGNEELAKKALENKVKADRDTEQYKQMYDQISAQTATVKAQVETLKSKLNEAKSREAMLIARSQMADTQKAIAKSTGGFDSSSASEKFNRMEEKISAKEAEAQAFSEIAMENNSETDDTLKQFEQLETNSQVNSELERLKAEMGL
jgi:phage shock protein A